MPNKKDLVRIHAFFEGRVQGVGFRFTAREIAQDLGITGWVKNLSDGRVELVAEGTRARVDELITLLRERPPFGGRVERVTRSELPAHKRAGVPRVVHVTAPFHPAAEPVEVHVGAGTKEAPERLDGFKIKFQD